MIDPPSLHAIAAMVLTGAMFYAFAAGKLKVEIICLLMLSIIALGLYWFPLPGQAPSDGLKLAFEGFGHYALITICALMILGRGLVVTGALEPVVQQLTRVWRFNQRLGLLVTLMLAMLMSMFVNDTPVLVLLLPILVTLATRGGMPASRTLIPVNSAVLIGGMATTIGTSTNLLVVSLATDLGMPAMSVFYFTPLVVAAAAVALPFMWLVMPKLLPDNSPEAGHSPRHFRAMLRLGTTSPAIGKTLESALGASVEGIDIVSAPERPLQAFDRLVISASHEAIEDVMRLLGATTAPLVLLERLKARSSASEEDLAVVELSVARDSTLIGRWIASSGIALTHDVAVIAVHHARSDNTDISSSAVEPPLAVGDIILATGTLTDLSRLAREEGLLMLDGYKEVPRTAKAPLALAIMAGAVVSASLGLLPIAISALGGAILMFVTGCVRFNRVGRALSANVIVLVAASIAVGRVILESGAAAWLGQLMALGLIHLPAGAVLAAVMVFVTVLTNFASNTTAAAVGTPIAFSLAQALSVPVEPLVLAVLFGCNLCYATPVAYQTNMMIMSAGDYRFGDYTRTGLPLVLIMIVTLSGLLTLRYGLY
ncbi:di/tricarboxylate transporter [Polymorphobacter multimanifer]|uniref:Di/tricarboxylate transporter n=1 Tax=Polymorphobacter multimanifer TaxID=1070431 RepID=A0A841L595_9SPHN|nr:SLC13 family permease [Polymorphobacter multimanifer]MBB6227590.1 di/tricarboxylate transporter [Polymorphobacter multimanifer]